jgi:WD40 repeat protein
LEFGEFHRLQIGLDGSRVLLMEGKDHVAVCDALSGKRIGPVISNLLAYPTLSPDGRTVALTDGFGSLREGRFTLWETERGRSIAISSDQDVPLSVRFSPDSYNVIAVGKNRADKIWDVHAGRAAGPVLPNFGLRSDHEFSPDGSMVAVAHRDGIVRVWHLAGYGNGVREAPRHGDGLGEVFRVWRFAIDRPHFLSRSSMNSRPSSKRLSGLCESLKVLPPSVHDAEVFAQFSPDGHRLVTVAVGKSGIPGSTALLWDAAAGRLLGQPIEHPDPPAHVEFSADSRLLVTASPARLFDTHTGEPIGTPLLHGKYVYDAGFSSDGRRLVTCSVDGTAQLWDTASAKPIGPRLRHADAVLRAVFSPDGRYVATASSDGTARLWDAASGHPVGRTLSHGYPLFDIAFDTHGRMLMTHGWRTKLDSNYGFRIWDVATQQELSPKIFRMSAEECGFWSIEAVLDPEGLWVPEGKKSMNYDLRPEQRPAEDLVKLAQLHVGQRLDEWGSLAPLTKAELRNLWNEQRAKYPDEFTVRPDAVRAWRLERIRTLEGIGNDSKQAMAPAIRLHREWLKKLDVKRP